MKILITGGAGFIGQYTVEECIARGHEPYIFDHYDRREDYPCPVILGDVRDDIAVTEAMAHADAWIHLAAVLGTQETVFNPTARSAIKFDGWIKYARGCGSI